MLALHPTDMEYGHRVVAEQLRANYRAYGRDLAERGYVVLAPAYPIMAGYQPDLKALGYQSGTMKAIWDNIRGLDLLESLPFVRKGKLGAIGHSLGGHNAIYTAVFDPRIQVVVSSCGFDSYLDYYDGEPGQLAAGARLVSDPLHAPAGGLSRAPGGDPLRLPRTDRRAGAAARLRQRPAARRQLPLAKCGPGPECGFRRLSALRRAAEPPGRTSGLRARLPARRCATPPTVSWTSTCVLNKQLTCDALRVPKVKQFSLPGRVSAGAVAGSACARGKGRGST